MGKVVNIFTYPNRSENDKVKIQIGEKYKEAASKKLVKMDISELPIDGHICHIFSSIKLGKRYQLVYKNVYGIAFGISHKDHLNAYKCYMCHHGDNGEHSITINYRTGTGHINVLNLFYNYLKMYSINDISEITGREERWAAFKVTPMNYKKFIDFGDIVFGDDFNGSLKKTKKRVTKTASKSHRQYTLVRNECIECFLKYKDKSRFTPRGNIIKCMKENAKDDWPEDWAKWTVKNAGEIIKDIEIEI